MMINEGEVICDKCNGTGLLEHGRMCPKCGGEGNLDWVSNAMGGQDYITEWRAAGLYFKGTTYPIGATARPVNNLTDAQIIAKERGL